MLKTTIWVPPRSLLTVNVPLGKLMLVTVKTRLPLASSVPADALTERPLVIVVLVPASKRVPVVRDGKLVGIVSRANLVRALATTRSASPTIGDPDDRAIGDQLLAELWGKNWVDISSADIIVRDRVVHLWFSDDQTREERLTLRVAAENIPGVRRVEEHTVAQPTPAVRKSCG
jgi:CBS domain-containing protein